VIAALAGQQTALRGLVTDARAGLADGERVLGPVDEVSGRVNGTVGTVERILLNLRDPSGAGGPVSLDIQSYIRALERLDDAVAKVNTALAAGQSLLGSPDATARLADVDRLVQTQLEGVAGEGRAWVDHLAWRAAQLIVLFFVLLVVARVVSGRIIARRPST
jgi:hypothetical protein